MSKTFLIIDRYKNTVEIPVEIWNQFLLWLKKEQFDYIMSTAQKNKTMRTLDCCIHKFIHKQEEKQ